MTSPDSTMSEDGNMLDDEVEELGNAALWWQGWTDSFSLEPPLVPPFKETREYLETTLTCFENGVRGLNLHVRNLKSKRVGSFLIDDISIPQKLNFPRSFSCVQNQYPLAKNDAEENEIVKNSIVSGSFVSIVTCTKLTDSGLMRIVQESSKTLLFA